MNQLRFCSLVGLILLGLPLGCAPVESGESDLIGEAQQNVETEALDQEFTTEMGVGQPFGATNTMAQVITAGHTGRLTRVSLKASPCWAEWNKPCDFTLRVRTLNASGDPDVVLATQRAREPFPSSGATFVWTDVVFATPAFVQAGTKYALELVPDWWMMVPLGSGYGRGEAMQWQNGYNYWARFGDGWDLLFRTFVVDPGPVLPGIRCDNRVRLRSWKGDYLHRPDSPQGVTTWDTGIGNEWTVECKANGSIQLRSWKGDYLHRPDSPQGVTTWNTGIGNEWAFEALANGNVQLRSWKGDYLHRPDSPQGVTTWFFGEWTVDLLP